MLEWIFSFLIVSVFMYATGLFVYAMFCANGFITWIAAAGIIALVITATRFIHLILFYER